jgi:hypothetical protein
VMAAAALLLLVGGLMFGLLLRGFEVGAAPEPEAEGVAAA